MPFSDDLPGMVRDLMWVVRPSETHLSQSSTPGASSALARNDDNALVTQAVLFPAENVIKVVAAASVTVGIVVSIVAVKATPHVRNRFNDLKSKLNRKPEDTVEAFAQEAVEPELAFGCSVRLDDQPTGLNITVADDGLEKADS